MSAREASGPAACEPPTVAGRCVTCSDAAAVMWVLVARDGIAACVDEQGAEHQVAVELVEPVTPGDRVLVHAGVAIA